MDVERSFEAPDRVVSEIIRPVQGKRAGALAERISKNAAHRSRTRGQSRGDREGNAPEKQQSNVDEEHILDIRV